MALEQGLIVAQHAAAGEQGLIVAQHAAAGEQGLIVAQQTAMGEALTSSSPGNTVRPLHCCL
jgi:hypothetical protein